MALQVWLSQRLDGLIRPLARYLTERSSLLAPARVVLAGPAHASFARTRLAEELGALPAARFGYLESALVSAVEEVSPVRVLRAASLELSLLGLFASAEGRGRPDLAAALRYVEPTRPGADARAAGLAHELAELFAGYALARPELWRALVTGAELEGVSSAEGAPFAAERAVVRALFDERGVFRRRGVGEPARVLLGDAAAFVPRARARERPPLVLFGATSLPTAALALVGALSRTHDVAVFALDPCSEFWEDIGEDPSDPVLLARWGRPSRDFARALVELAGGDFEPAFGPPSADAGTLLAELQGAWLERRREQAQPPDASLRVCSFADPVREVLAATLELERALAASLAATGPPMRLHEVGFALPEGARARYLPELRRSLAALGAQVREVERATEDRPAVRGIVDLLELPGAGLSRERMLALLSNEAVVQPDDDVSTAAVLELCDRLHALYGADERDLEGTYVERDVLTWQQAVRRVALGALMVGARAGSERPFEWPGGGRYLPEELGPGSLGAGARFVRVARELVRFAKTAERAALSPKGWAEWLAGAAAAIVRPEDPAELRARGRALDALTAAGGAQHDDGVLLPFSAVKPTFGRALAEVRTPDELATAGGVLVGSLRALHGLPLRQLFVLGLSEGQFPAGSPTRSLDLRGGHHRAGDLSPADRDRALLLLTLHGARAVWLSRPDATGDDARAPSSVLQDLTRAVPLLGPSVAAPCSDPADARAPEEELVRRAHAVGVAAEAAGLGGAATSALLRAAPDAARAPLVALLRAEPIEACLGAEAVRPRRVLELSLGALRSFLLCPLQGSARHALGLSEDGGDPLGETEELLEGGELARWVLLRDVLDGMCAGLPAGALLSELYERAELRGEAPTGLFGDVERETLQAAVLAHVKNHETVGLKTPRGLSRVVFGRGARPSVTPSGVLEAPRAREQRPALELVSGDLRVRLTGETSLLSPSRDVALDHVKELRGPKAWLRAALGVVALAAAGDPLPERVMLVASPRAAITARRKIVLPFAPPSRDAAVEWLVDVARELFLRSHGYRLPIEAVAQAWRSRAFEDAVLSLAAAPFGDSSRFGPVEDLDAYGPLDDDEADALVARRFSVLRPLFEAEPQARARP